MNFKFALYIAIIIFVFLILPWLHAINQKPGIKRYKNICQLCMVTNFLFFLALSYSLLFFLLGERSDLIGIITFFFCIITSLTLGPILGIKIFTYVFKEKLGKVGAKQICMGKV